MTWASTPLVEKALDRYCDKMRRSGIEPEGIRVRTLAKLARVTPKNMSLYLQQYRMAQRSEQTRYVIAARGYGVNSRWKILAKPGSDPKVIQAARTQATIWSVSDAARRFASDVIHEIRPGLSGKETDELIAQVLPLVQDQHMAIVRHVERVLNGPK